MASSCPQRKGEETREEEATLRVITAELSRLNIRSSPSVPCRPTMNDLIMLKKDGKKLQIIKWITAHTSAQCDDFVQMLLNDSVTVKELHKKNDQDDEFVRAALKRWLSRDDDDVSIPCTWEAFIQCVDDADLDRILVKDLRNNVLGVCTAGGTMDIPDHRRQPSDEAKGCDNTPMLPMEETSHNVFRKKSQRITIQIGEVKISLQLLDTSKQILKFNKKKVYALFFPKFHKCKDDRALVILARDELEYQIYNKQQPELPELTWTDPRETPVLDTHDTQTSFSSDTQTSFSSDTQTSFSSDTSFCADTQTSFSSDTQTSFSADTAAKCQTQHTSFDLESSLPTEETDNPANLKQQPATTALQKEAVNHYEKTHPDVYVEKMSKFLSDSTKRISGKAHYRILQRTNSAPVGLIYLEIVKHPKNRLDETDDVYHVIQALLYAGGKSGYKYCEYIQHGLGKDNIFAPITVEPDRDWQTTHVHKALKFCDYFDEMWAHLKRQYAQASSCQ